MWKQNIAGARGGGVVGGGEGGGETGALVATPFVCIFHILTSLE